MQKSSHHRRSIRMAGYDYCLPGAYFVTIVTHERHPLFAEIENEKIHFTRLGEIVALTWQNLPRFFPFISIGEWVLMPNHLHGILVIVEMKNTTVDQSQSQRGYNLNYSTNAEGERAHGTSSGSLGAIIQNFKSISTRKVNAFRSSPGSILWQRNYYERIIRDEAEWAKICNYIQTNPMTWKSDTLFVP